MKSASWIAAGVTVATIGWIASGQVAGAPDQETSVKVEQNSAPTVTVVRSDAVSALRTLSVRARTEAARIVQVRSETAAQVRSIAVKKGQRVSKGDILVKLALDDRQAKVQEATALVAQRQVAFDASERLAQKAFRSEVQRAQANAELQAAKAAQAAAALDVSRTVIRAPFDGLVNDVPVEIGDRVSVGQSVATFVDTDPVLVVAEVPEQAIFGLHVGDQAAGLLTGGESIQGKISYVAHSANPETRSFRIEVSVPNTDGHILEGMTAFLKLPVDQVRVHTLSRDLITLSDDGIYGVKAVKADGTVAFYPVTYVDETETDVVVTGLPNHLRIIKGGASYTRQGQEVAVRDASDAFRIASAN